MIWINADPGFF